MQTLFLLYTVHVHVHQYIHVYHFLWIHGIVEELNDWQDPELQADIEGALGVDLGSKKKKGKGKGKGKKSKEPKYPNLTDINVVENPARTRLEKKVLNKWVQSAISILTDTCIS